MTFEEMPDEWQEWLELTPIERFRQSEKLKRLFEWLG